MYKGAFTLVCMPLHDKQVLVRINLFIDGKIMEMTVADLHVIHAVIVVIEYRET